MRLSNLFMSDFQVTLQLLQIEKGEILIEKIYPAKNHFHSRHLQTPNR